MSIINDALKKTQKNIENNDKNSSLPKLQQMEAPQQAYKPSHSQISQEPKEPKKLKKFKIFSLLFPTVTLIIIVFFINYIYKKAYAPIPKLHLLSPTKKEKISSKDPINPLQKTSESLNQTKTQTPQALTSLQLSGIMKMDENFVALINNDVYSLGETVRGMVITKITLKQVFLSQGEENLILDVRQSH